VCIAAGSTRIEIEVSSGQCSQHFSLNTLTNVAHNASSITPAFAAREYSHVLRSASWNGSAG
jgi:hypothetical protein